MNEKEIGSLYLIMAFALAGTSVITGKYLSGQLGVFTISAISLSLATIALWPIAMKHGRICFAKLILRDWIMLFFQALCGIFLFRMFMLLGLQRTSAAEAGILTGATPAVTAVLARLALKEKVRPLQWTGIICTVGGILCLQKEWPDAAEFFSGQNGHLFGNLLIFCAAASESSFNVLARLCHIRSTHQERSPISPLGATTIVSAMAGLMCLPLALTEQPFERLTRLTPGGWGALVWYGIIVTGVAFIFFYGGIRRQNAHVAAALSGMMPFTALLLSILILGEQPVPQQWLGGAMVIGGMLLLSGLRWVKLSKRHDFEDDLV